MKRLVIASVGDRSLHRSWLSGSDKPNFDLWLVYYGEGKNRYKEDGARYLSLKGGKWLNLCALTEDSDLSDYTSIFAPDDDLQMDCDTINKMFDLFEHHQLSLAQPAFTWDSLARWNITVLRPFMSLRWTNFVENGAVIFSGQAFSKCRPTFHKSVSGFGLDLLWPYLLGYPKRGIAILDETPCGHLGEHSDLDTLMPREDHQSEGDRLLKGLTLEPVTEHDFVLNANGEDMVSSGKTRNTVRKLAEVYLQTLPGLESKK